LRKRPFPPEKTAVVLQQLTRSDETGRATLQVSAKHGDRVHYEEGDRTVTPASPVVQGGRLETDAMIVTFLAVDSTGVHDAGDPRRWENTVAVKYQLSYRDGSHRVTLKAVPDGTIRFTLDGSGARYGRVYDGEIVVPQTCDMLLAVADASGIWSEQLKVTIPKGEDEPEPVDIDPLQPAEWRLRLKCPDRRRSFEVLGILKRFDAEVGGAQINLSMPNSTEDWISLSFGQNVLRTAEFLETKAEELASNLGCQPQPDLGLNISRIKFATGRALVEAAKELGEVLKPGEVVQ
jgi:hypothetical protein